MRWTKYKDKMPEQHGAELHWRNASDKSPLHMYQHVVLGELIVEYQAGRYKYDLSTLEYLDESLPASLDLTEVEKEAAELYPFVDEADNDPEINPDAAARSAHITCALMYTGEIERLKGENNTMRRALEKSLEWIADVKQKDVPLDDKKGMALYHIKWLATEALKTTP